jgi:hypothetical protein
MFENGGRNESELMGNGEQDLIPHVLPNPGRSAMVLMCASDKFFLRADTADHKRPRGLEISPDTSSESASRFNTSIRLLKFLEMWVVVCYQFC